MVRLIVQLALFAMLVLPSHAQGWVVDRVRGSAEQMIGRQWVPLQRGASVNDGVSVKTGADGRVGLIRGAERVELEPGTQILLHEGAGKLTSLEQKSGLINVDVERRNVQHFSVQTPFLAAVVKGTKFSVSVGKSSAHVSVDRGTVQVQDTLNDLVVDITRGQEADVSRNNPLTVTGEGVIAIFTFDGQRVVNGTDDVPADQRGEPIASPTGSNASSVTPAVQAGIGGNGVQASINSRNSGQGIGAIEVGANANIGQSNAGPGINGGVSVGVGANGNNSQASVAAAASVGSNNGQANVNASLSNGSGNGGGSVSANVSAGLDTGSGTGPSVGVTIGNGVGVSLGLGNGGPGLGLGIGLH